MFFKSKEDNKREEVKNNIIKMVEDNQLWNSDLIDIIYVIFKEQDKLLNYLDGESAKELARHILKEEKPSKRIKNPEEVLTYIKRNKKVDVPTEQWQKDVEKRLAILERNEVFTKKERKGLYKVKWPE